MELHEGAPGIRELARNEIDAILSRNHVGRLGYARGSQIEIRPVHYVFSDGWLYGRTSLGSKYDALGETFYHWWPVVFEVDEVEELFRWRSVLVHGGFHVIEREGPASERETWMKAVGLLRTLVPDTLSENDPVPSRTVLFRISVQEASGREATPPAGQA
jgi:nitroimidazol reductase NimA-like FMN-containing flavoprotein (pyridoxamine 5'-phosphate oxidase superfamily)